MPLPYICEKCHYCQLFDTLLPFYIGYTTSYTLTRTLSHYSFTYPSFHTHAHDFIELAGPLFMHMMLREYDALLTKPLPHSLRSLTLSSPNKLAVENPNTPSSNSLPGLSSTLSSNTLSEILTTIGSLGKATDESLDKGIDSEKRSMEDVFLFLNPANANAFVNHRR